MVQKREREGNMPFGNIIYESSKRYLLEKIRDGDTEYLRKTKDNFCISEEEVQQLLEECLRDAIIIEKDTGIGFELVSGEWDFVYNQKAGLSEDRIYSGDIQSILKYDKKEAKQIWSYVFSEIMNNAIEHSKSQMIYCHVKKDYLYTEISITDDGIGIFENIKSVLSSMLKQHVDNQDALIELYKGKFTTNKESHSGEGIFFSSKLMDEFAVWSDNTVFHTGYYKEDRLVQSHLIAYYTKLKRIGTMVVMKLSNQTNRTMKGVIDMYAPIDEGFSRTVIPVKDTCLCGEPVARSHARRVLFRLEEFKHIDFDFSGVEFMGQGFADEVFRVFQNKYPDIELRAINANESVLGMIKHVRVNMTASR